MTTLHPNAAGRDSVAAAIETLLHDMEAKGMGILRVACAADMVNLSFGGLDSEGMNLDIALVRLASLMMEDARYTCIIMDALHRPMHSSAV